MYVDPFLMVNSCIASNIRVERVVHMAREARALRPESGNVRARID